MSWMDPLREPLGSQASHEALLEQCWLGARAQSRLLTLCSGTEYFGLLNPAGLGSSDPTRQVAVRTHPVRGSGLTIQLALDSLTVPLPPGTMKSGETTIS